MLTNRKQTPMVAGALSSKWRGWPPVFREKHSIAAYSCGWWIRLGSGVKYGDQQRSPQGKVPEPRPGEKQSSWRDLSGRMCVQPDRDTEACAAGGHRSIGPRTVECKNQLAPAGTGESAEICPPGSSCIWERGTIFFSLLRICWIWNSQGIMKSCYTKPYYYICLL